ncbi:universal stress protein [Sediminivirga luteola]|uniref:Universal stress protein UspA n=1 Tax=Sediminivirga luteola TaxID=1774748 RepID=A0A8J2XJF9_9MICO|nr:universal stress protein [Sediminivirga luteola]MCI2264440.1 universal stress protein [Sediminivirga luteola]GGA06199.1 universal stress protein UspA [Sediminivirga luteola]
MTIVIGYLPAPEGEAALDVGFAEAKLRGLDVVVINSPRRGADGVTALSAEDIAALEARGTESGVGVTVLQPGHEDDLVGVFNDTVAEYGSTMIVIGLRKRTAVGKFILGSQAQRILLEADVPVLTVKA